MKKCLLFILSITGYFHLQSQSSADAAVQLSALIQVNPAQITLNWVGNGTSNQYQVFRKLKNGTSWGLAIASLPGTTNQFIDNNVIAGVSYEYRVIRTGSNYTGFGYINSGIGRTSRGIGNHHIVIASRVGCERITQITV